MPFRPCSRCGSACIVSHTSRASIICHPCRRELRGRPRDVRLRDIPRHSVRSLTCPSCKRRFQTTHRTRRYCSPNCREVHGKATSNWQRRPNDAAAKERARTYSTAEHKRLRAHYKRLVANGSEYCWRCSRRIDPRSAWHLGHDDNDRTLYRGAEHAQCNIRAAARSGWEAQQRRVV